MANPMTAADLMELGLCRRESEVLVLVGRGKTNAEIGATLNISPRTVKKHLERVFRKLEVRTRTAAVYIASESLTHPRAPGIESSLTH
ncbi:MAG: LuxR C-terminal-related transcriptional regulator [Terracidiphilus sp.]|jgi:DNA-binding NarL/FixJ family response regulator